MGQLGEGQLDVIAFEINLFPLANSTNEQTLVQNNKQDTENLTD